MISWEGSEDMCATEGSDKLSIPCWLTPKDRNVQGRYRKPWQKKKKKNKTGRPPEIFTIFP